MSGNDYKHVVIPQDKILAFIRKAYAMSKPQGMGFLHFEEGELSDADLLNIMEHAQCGSIHLDYVKGRSVKLFLQRDKGSKDYSFGYFQPDPWYDHSMEQFEELLQVLQ